MGGHHPDDGLRTIDFNFHWSRPPTNVSPSGSVFGKEAMGRRDLAESRNSKPEIFSGPVICHAASG